MKRFAFLVAVCTGVFTLVLPFVGGSGPSLFETSAVASVSQHTGIPIFASVQHTAEHVAAPVQVVNQSEAVAEANSKTRAAELTKDSEHMAQKPVPKPVVVQVPGTRGNGGAAARRAAVEASGGSCPAAVGGSTAGAPSKTSAGGVAGTTSSDLASFAAQFNAIRVANCLPPVPLANIRYDSCMEARLFWMAEDPSEDPASAWGHMGSVRSDGLPSVGCDGNLAGGSGNTGSTVATKWWNSAPHRASLYKPERTGSTSGVCIYFAMTHGGLPNESSSFTRAAAKWGGC